MWLATARTDLSWIRAIERRFGCCGYYNVFDYCCMDQMSTIMGVAGHDYRTFIDGFDDFRTSGNPGNPSQPDKEPYVAPKSTVIPRTGPIEDETNDMYGYSVVDGEIGDIYPNYGTVYGYSSEYGAVDGTIDEETDFDYGYGEYVSEISEENTEDSTRSPNEIPQLRTSDPKERTSGESCTPSSDNEYCVCDKAEETGRLAQLGFLTMTCKFNISTREPIIVQDSCPTKVCADFRFFIYKILLVGSFWQRNMPIEWLCRYVNCSCCWCSHSIGHYFHCLSNFYLFFRVILFFATQLLLLERV